MRSRRAGNVTWKVNRDFTFALLIFLFAASCLPTIAAAQEDQSNDVAPPTKIISQVERKTLDSESSIKKRTSLSLGMMETRLLQAEKLISENNFKNSLDELGSFQALLDNTMSFLEKNDMNNRADRKFKDFEIFLRRQAPRLEVIRREMPFKYGYYVQRLMVAVRDARAKAVEPLFDNQVVPSTTAVN